jgi:CubicO group peptidase (beta-lactamase class C family)
MFTAPKNESHPDYGLGWWRSAYHQWDNYYGSVSNPDTFGHQGFTGTLTMIDPDAHLVVVFLTNKIHSRILEGDETLNQYKGGFYTTGRLGFVPEILEIGMRGGSDEKEVLKSLLADMTADAARKLSQSDITDPAHPLVRAYESLRSVLENYGS